MQVNMNTVQTEHLMAESTNWTHKFRTFSKSAMLRSSLILWCWKVLLIILPLLLKIPKICKTHWWRTMCDKLQRAVWYSGAPKGCEVHAESARSSRQWPVETIMRHLEQLYRSNYPGATISQPFTVIRCFNSCTKARHKPAPLIVSCNNRRETVALP